MPSGTESGRGRLRAGVDASVVERLPFVAAFIALAFIVFVIRLFQLQVLEGEDLGNRARRNSVRTVRLEAARGNIVDRFSRELATTRPAFGVQMMPAELRRAELTFAALASLIDVEAPVLAARVGEPQGRKRFQPVRLAEDLSYDSRSRIDETTTRLPALSDITLALALEDLDGDTDLDIVVANRIPTTSKILVNNGVGFFTDESVQRFSTPPPFAGDVVVADVNGDGSKDIIFASVSGGPLVFINSGGGDFTEETNTRTPTFSDSHGLAVADVDTDGDVDVFVAILGGVNTPPAQSRLLLNNGNGFFTDVSDTNLPTVVEVIRYASFVDVDNDGDPDLYIPVWDDGATNQDRLLINLGLP